MSGARLALVAAAVLGLVAIAIVAASSCAAPATGDIASGRRVVVEEAPEAQVEIHPEPERRYAPGSRVRVVREREDQVSTRIASEGLVAAGGVVVSYDGLQLLFVGRRAEGGRHAVFVARADGSGARELVGEPYDCGAAAFLPDARVVFSARTDGPAPPGLTSAWALFVTTTEREPGDRTVRRITFGGTELDPAVLADGRIVYAQWQPPGDGRGASGAFALFTVHPDGTGMAPFSGTHGGPSWKLRPRQIDGGDVVFVGREPEGLATSWRARWSDPAEPSPEPGPRQTSAGEEAVRPEPGYALVDARVVGRQPRPQGHLSMVDPEQSAGALLAIDARPDGLGTAARIRVVEGGESRELGRVALAADGSFFVRVPADRPLLVDVLDDAGRVVGSSATPVWVRPNETRGCVGCHEDPRTAPPNRRPLAVLGEAVDLLGGGT